MADTPPPKKKRGRKPLPKKDEPKEKTYKKRGRKPKNLEEPTLDTTKLDELLNVCTLKFPSSDVVPPLALIKVTFRTVILNCLDTALDFASVAVTVKVVSVSEDTAGAVPLNAAVDELIDIPLPSKIVVNDKKLIASYINFYFSKHKIFVPKFNVKEDEMVYDIFKDIFKDKKIEMIETSHINYGGGNIHCVTMNVPKNVN